MTAVTIDRAVVERWRDDPLRFFEDALVQPDGRSYGQQLDDWQRDDLLLLRGDEHVWWERPRGHSKTHDAAAYALHHLLTTPGARVYFTASDRDQAALAFDSLKGFVRRSPLLASTFKLGRWRLEASSIDATLDVLPADAPGSWGLRPSLVVVDELQAWRGGNAEELLYALHSSLGKAPGKMLIATTAGSDPQSLCWMFRAAVMDDPAWRFSRRGQCASWISAAFLDEQKRTLPDIIFRQVHLNEWTEGGVGSFVTVEQWEACERPLRPMRDDDRTPLVVGVDVGIRHDFTAVVAVSRDPDRPRDGVAVRALKVWQPPAQGEVDLSEVDAYVRDLIAKRHVACLALDWWQSAGLMQGWRELAWCQDFSQGERRAQADTALLSLILDKRLRHSGEPELRQAIMSATGKVAIWEDKIRLAKSNPRGRIDAAVALSMAASECLRLSL